ncbi:D-alanyl-D-alanine carboxypeptidase/D-alanyl-D-alanine-endopeptidase (penicillin-binding protein 4) [Pseudomonas duriflava]|uniref:D-alanyl-D-alanine carboxypeptidase/D-alanyl-D-alanine-endopeptidase (Penicillin-binding protein 4) n=1 Tax=Pseudomonas duriflava TaxID=459528 RepID=A0A562QG34_9PSED|nr:D-alanyl-D-alanine carboxypeptidase/D-alanyl-D-alanine-endopeptidase [Pseudomonas duriflava]TWI55704.1 D-alanyl-D-alanine carboxypeptidase/D-alanyl-D-alanine-endopeptidase (penicillin-binding protein 4) [Pseudomonas duriflava]
MLKLLRPFSLLLGLLPLSLPVSVQADTALLPAKVQQALQKNKLPNDALSLVLLPLDASGAPDYFNADVSVNPASTMKLITTFAALELLGPTYQWKTEFYTDGQLKNGVLNGNLYLKGGGDPKLNMEKLWLMMRDLRANGVTQVNGDLVLDRGRFIKPQLPVFNDDGNDENKPFLVGPDALLVNLKSVRMVIRANDGQASVTMDPPLTNVRIENQVKALGKGKCPAWPEIRFNPVTQTDGTALIVTGSLPNGCSAQSYLSLLDHPSYTAGAVRAIWKELGGSILGKDREGTVPKSAELLARSFSPDLVEIIRDINKYSNNTMARQLFLSIGAQFRTSADADDGVAAQRVIRQWLARKGIMATHLVIENGSGLSRDERVSARELAEILQAAWRSPYAAEYMSSLPLAGMDGTLRKRLKNTPLEGQAHMKTGTLNNVRALAGFSRDANGKTWAVVAILNSTRPWGASSVLDQVLVDLYNRTRQESTANR